MNLRFISLPLLVGAAIFFVPSDAWAEPKPRSFVYKTVGESNAKAAFARSLEFVSFHLIAE